jgi:hypothetical protein
MSHSRRSFLSRMSRALGGALTVAIFGEQKAFGLSQSCSGAPGQNIQISSTCRVQYGPPGEFGSSVTVYSPNEFQLNVTTYYVVCVVACLCIGAVVTARGAACNSGKCGCDAITTP